MSEKSQNNIHANLLQGLQAEDHKTVIDSIKQLRQSGKLSDITVLFDLLVSNKNEDVQHEILSLLNDVKDKNAVEIIVDAIRDAKYASIQKEIVSICWESSLDFSPYVAVFVDVLIEAEFMTAFEAFTVIENFTEVIEENLRIEQQDKLKDAIPVAQEERKGMLHEAIHILGGE